MEMVMFKKILWIMLFFQGCMLEEGMDNSDVLCKKPHKRGVGIMMQDQPLYEHLSVEKNIAFPLLARGEKKPNVSQILDQLQLTSIAKQIVSTCSGGERRRVALGRAIILKPRVLLLDEPLVSLDEELRTALQEFIKKSLMNHGSRRTAHQPMWQ